MLSISAEAGSNSGRNSNSSIGHDQYDNDGDYDYDHDNDDQNEANVLTLITLLLFLPFGEGRRGKKVLAAAQTKPRKMLREKYKFYIYTHIFSSCSQPPSKGGRLCVVRPPSSPWLLGRVFSFLCVCVCVCAVVLCSLGTRRMHSIGLAAGARWDGAASLELPVFPSHGEWCGW